MILQKVKKTTIFRKTRLQKIMKIRENRKDVHDMGKYYERTPS
jgi:hypothetical protein